MEDCCACVTCTYYANQRAADANTLASIILKLKNKGEQVMIVDSLEQCATIAHDRAGVLERSVPSSSTSEYYPNRELAKSWDSRANALCILAGQVKSQ